MKKRDMQDNIFEVIGIRLRRIRDLRGYSRSTVAELAGISEKHLYNIEMGNVRMSVDRLVDLCDILEVSSNYILDGNVDEHMTILL